MYSFVAGLKSSRSLKESKCIALCNVYKCSELVSIISVLSRVVQCSGKSGEYRGEEECRVYPGDRQVYKLFSFRSIWETGEIIVTSSSSIGYKVKC